MPVANGIELVLGGTLPVCNFDYSCHLPTRKRWFSLTVIAVDNQVGGVIPQ